MNTIIVAYTYADYDNCDNQYKEMRLLSDDWIAITENFVKSLHKLCKGRINKDIYNPRTLRIVSVQVVLGTNA